MSALTALGALGSGAVQGAGAGAGLLQRAQQIQQGRMALDVAQKQLQADAAAFSGLDAGGGGMPGGFAPALPGPQGAPVTPPQAMPPGQASVPNMPAGGPPAVPGGLSPAMASPGASAQPAPPAPAGGGFSGGDQQPGGMGGGLDPTDPRAPVMAVMSIAREIKSRNPGIDPQTLMLATQRVIEMSKGMAPALRQGAQVVVQQMRDATSRANTQDRIAATERGQDIGAQNVDKRVGAQRDIAAGHDAAAMARTSATIKGAMDRAQYVQQQTNQRVQSGQMTRERGQAVSERMKAATAKLSAAQRQLGSLQGALVAADDPRMAQAQKRVQEATAEIDRVSNTIGVQAPAPAAAPTPQAVQSTPAAGAGRPTATGPNGEKVEWNGTAWVPVGK